MTTVETVLSREGFDVAELSGDFDLVAELRRVNEQHGRQGAPCWFLYHREEFPGLTVGVHGDRGALYWDDLDTPATPVHGTNAEHVDYFTGGVHHYTFPPSAELPLEHVLAAVTEFVRTGQRPTCVEWNERSA